MLKHINGNASGRNFILFKPVRSDN